jgi:hypothetical protein
MKKKKMLYALFVTTVLASGAASAAEPMPTPADDDRFTVQTAT